MNANVIGFVVVSLISAAAYFLIRLKALEDKAAKLQREKDVAKIKDDSKTEINTAHLNILVTRLNDKIASDKRGSGTK